MAVVSVEGGSGQLRSWQCDFQNKDGRGGSPDTQDTRHKTHQRRRQHREARQSNREAKTEAAVVWA